MSHRSHYQVPIEIIKKAFDIKINHPVATPATLTCYPHRVQSRLAGTIPIRVFVEVWFDLRFKHQLHDHLSDSVRNGRNPQRSSLARVAFWNLDETNRRREVTARRHSIPDLVEIPLQVLLEVHQRLTVHTGRSAIRLDFLYASQTICFGIAYGFAVVMNSSFAVGSFHQLNNLVPSLHVHYRRFLTTTDQSAPVPRISTQVLVVLPLGRLP